MGTQWKIDLWEGSVFLTAPIPGIKEEEAISSLNHSTNRAPISLTWIGDLNRDQRPDLALLAPEKVWRRNYTQHGRGKDSTLVPEHRHVLLLSNPEGYTVSANLGKVSLPRFKETRLAHPDSMKSWIRERSKVKIFGLVGMELVVLVGADGKAQKSFPRRPYGDTLAVKEAQRLLEGVEFVPASRDVYKVPHPFTVNFYFPSFFPPNTPISDKMQDPAARTYLEEAIETVEGHLGANTFEDWTQPAPLFPYSMGLFDYKGPPPPPEIEPLEGEEWPLVHRFYYRFHLPVANPLSQIKRPTLYMFEFVFSPQQQYQGKIDSLLPACARNPELTQFEDPEVCFKAANEAARPKGDWQSCQIEFNPNGKGRFAWRFTHTRITRNPKGVLTQVWVDAHSGQVVKKRVDRNARVGK